MCARVLEMERVALVVTRPGLQTRFGAGEVLSANNMAWLKTYALGYRRCMARRTLAQVLAIPKLKGGEALYAAYTPKPRLGNFSDENTQDFKALIIARSNDGGLDRPVDWQKDPMPLQMERRLHQAYSELVKLGFCHNAVFCLAGSGALL